MDMIDKEILKILQDNARIKKSEMARALNLAATTLQERIRRLENKGIIKKYQVVVDPEMIGFSVQAFVAVTLDKHESSDIRHFEKSIKTIPNIKACYHSSGRFDYLLHVVARDLNQLGVLVKTGITSLPDFGRCETHLVFSEIETSEQWPFLDEQAMD
ncbi:MAG: Lrp/AsnC family transcriptional regulator [Desulfobacterales bacterium]|nr:Lrp/AsnC family transcriptional regulator [Desulfobacterales bacterium]MDX2512268.1 Lrp/AsnC family transcriptional regulator [Desulfobacterales bacterium]